MTRQERETVEKAKRDLDGRDEDARDELLMELLVAAYRTKRAQDC